ncbi:MAG: hypothetical protein M1838_001129 [Thelocarpon superellum]|nr:MAG: hypothetical protein M1838_001129 [Thelocarpon superellum]
MPDRFKLIFFAPLDPLEEIKTAVFATGAGTFPGGKYTHCCFQSLGTGQFLPVGERGAVPHIGTPDQLEKVEEARLEILVVGRDVLTHAVEALKK